MTRAADLSIEELAEIGRATIEGQKPTGYIILTLDDGTTRRLKTGAFAQISAKRQFGAPALQAGDPEAVLWAAWVEMEGPPEKGSDIVERFDAWLKRIPGITFETEATRAEAEAADGDPPPAESSASSPASPPTSD